LRIGEKPPMPQPGGYTRDILTEDGRKVEISYDTQLLMYLKLMGQTFTSSKLAYDLTKFPMGMI
jgi:hypothetical protein